MRKLFRLIAGAKVFTDQSGLAAVEFAMLLPVLLTLFIGSYETSALLLAYLKLEAAAETAADLVAQTDVKTTLTADSFTNITNAVDQVMTPLSTTNLKIAYASVTYDTGKAVIDWQDPTSGPISLASLPNGVNASTLGANSSMDSVIVVKLTYPYTSPLSSYFSSNYTLTASAFNRPRYVTCVPSYHNTNSQCP
jgi:Flp pilus assembly protein TadG